MSAHKVQPPFEIAGHKIPAGSHERVFLEVGTFLTSEILRLDVHVIHGKRPGPCMLLTAAIHGDESNGTEIIRRILREKQISKLRGTILAVPIVNRPGFVTRSRYMPDRRDLNRLFPGNSSGSLGSRLADVLVKELVTRADAVIDFHTGAVNRPNLPQLRVCSGVKNDLELAQIFGPPIILVGKPQDGTFRSTCREMKKPVLLFEGGEALRLDTPAIRFGVQGSIAVMKHLGMLPGRNSIKRKKAPVVSNRSIWERAPVGGIFTPLVSLGKAVTKGTQIGFIGDPHGNGETPVIASKDGVLIGRTNEATTDAGDGLFHIAQLSDLETAESDIVRTAELLPGNEESEDNHPVPYDYLNDTISPSS